MSTEIERLPLTKRLLAVLRAIQVDGVDLRVGDTVIPTQAGWVGEPNKTGSKFVPYAVLTTLTATRTEGSLADPQGDWVMPYAVQSFGVLPEQAQWLADLARAAVAALKGQIVSLGANYKIDWVKADQLGGVNRIAVANTAFYGIQDGVSLSLRKRRS